MLLCISYIIAILRLWIYFGPCLPWGFYWVSPLSLVQNMFFGSFESLILMFYDQGHFISSCCILWIPNIVWAPPFIHKWVCAFDSTHIMRNAQIKEELLLYWSSKFFFHFGTWCQWGRSLEGLGEVYVGVLVVVIHAYLQLFCMLIAWIFI